MPSNDNPPAVPTRAMGKQAFACSVAIKSAPKTHNNGAATITNQSLNHFAIFVLATSRAEAIGLSTEYATERYPASDGYESPSVGVTEIPADAIIEAARLTSLTPTEKHDA